MSKDKKQKLTLKVIDATGSVVREEELSEVIQSPNLHDHILYQYERMYQTNQRLGTAKTKDRSEVSGGGKKPWKQKGTGRARVGSNRSPIWTKGGITFGPRPKDYRYELPKKLKQQALVAAIQRKAQASDLYLSEDFSVESGKTKDCQQKIQAMKLKKALIVKEVHDPQTLRASNNLKKVFLQEANHVSAHDVLFSKECLFTRAGYNTLIERLTKKKTNTEVAE